MKKRYLGFTGTQSGMSAMQLEWVETFLTIDDALQPGLVIVHGDCIGADEEFHNIGTKLGIPSEIFPPDIDTKRAFCKGNIIHDPAPYIVRNHNIVDKSHVMLGMPGTFQEIIRSGTWATIRYTRKKNKLLFYMYPDGILKIDKPEEINI